MGYREQSRIHRTIESFADYIVEKMWERYDIDTVSRFLDMRLDKAQHFMEQVGAKPMMGLPGMDGIGIAIYDTYDSIYFDELLENRGVEDRVLIYRRSEIDDMPDAEVLHCSDCLYLKSSDKFQEHIDKDLVDEWGCIA